MATSELLINGNSEQAPQLAERNVQPQLAERKYGGEDSFRRINQLLTQLFGPSIHAQIQGLLDVRKGAPVTVHVSDSEREEAYQRGKADGRAQLQEEIVFAERLAEIRAKYPDFDYAWSSVRPLVPRGVWEEAANLEHGLEGAYQLSKLPELARELAALSPEKARERFRHFVRDLIALKGTAQ